MRICFLSLGAYPLLSDTPSGRFGGAEARAVSFARELARRGHEVSVVVLDHGQPALELREGIRVLAHEHYGVRPLDRVRRLLRRAARREATLLGGEGLLTYRLVRRRHASVFRRSGAEVFCAFGATEPAAELASAYRRWRWPYVFLAASDQDFAPGNRARSREVDPYGYLGHLNWLAFANADRIVVQSDAQRALVEARGLRAELVPPPIELEPPLPAAPKAPGSPLLWVGRVDEVKDPMAFVELARALPEQACVAVMPSRPGCEELERRVLAAAPANLEVVLDQLSPVALAERYAQALALVNTSRFEGWPRTFLEAAARELPILSLNADPDGFLSESGAGTCASGDPARLLSAARELLASPAQARAQGQRGAEHVRAHHDLRRCTDQLERVLRAARG